MKKLLMVLVFVLISGAVFADMSLMMGVNYSHGQLDWLVQSSNSVISGSTYYDIQEIPFPNNRFGLFFDAYFVRLDVAYSYQGNPLSFPTYSNNIRLNGSGAKSTGYWYNSVDVSLLAKLPIPISKSANIWIGAGIEYSINIALDLGENGTNQYRYGGTPGSATTTEGKDLNDFYVIGAVGATVDISENVAIVPMFRFGWNLSPTPYTDAALSDPNGGNKTNSTLLQAYKNNNNWTMYKYDLGIGLAIKL